ncbi:hypothetical protein [Acetobacter orientalis]|uniref:hypothetical protein n=1 Tax=Acetobacter orientalis TaxID=146474 RepID=UPI0039EC9F57
MKRCLVILDQPEHAPALLNAAAQLVALSGVKTLNILALRPNAAAKNMAQAPAEAYLFEEQHRSRLAALHTQFCHWLQTEYHHAQKQVEETEVNWLVDDGKKNTSISSFAQEADVILATMPQGSSPASLTETTLFGLARPVLLIPPYWDGGYGSSILVVWDNSVCAHKMLQASRTVLARASLLHLLAPHGQELPYSLLPPVMMEEHRLGQPFSLPRVMHTVATAKLAYPADLVVLGFDLGCTHNTQSGGSIANSSAGAALQAARVPLLVWGSQPAQQVYG